ncbi:MAG: hypothetical protein H8D46_00045 [FCB group bacterium]|nr:hypothetical protein [FCB group bacterium]
MNKNLVWIFSMAMSCSSIFGQLDQAYYGDMDFNYSGSMNGSFHAAFFDDDSLAIPSSGAFGAIWADSTGANIILPAFRPSPNTDQAMDLILMYMKDADGEVEPQSWNVTALDIEDPLNFDATLIYFPEVDSTLLADIIAPILDGEIDPDGIGDYVVEVLLDLIGDAFLPMSGEIAITAVDETHIEGTFSANLIKLVFPPQFLSISSGTYNMDAPEDVIVPEPPTNLQAELSGTDVLLTWDFSTSDLISNYLIYRSMDNQLFEVHGEVGDTSNFYTDFTTVAGEEYYYYVTAVSILTVESEPSNTVGIMISEGLPGDLNEDQTIDVLDIVRLVTIIMGDEPTEYEVWAGDVNNDGALDVLDIVLIVSIIMG